MTNKKNIIMGALILLILALSLFTGYLLINSIADKSGVLGYQVGYQNAIIEIANQAVTCNQIPLRVNNQTINLIAVACLQQQS